MGTACTAARNLATGAHAAHPGQHMLVLLRVAPMHPRKGHEVRIALFAARLAQLLRQRRQLASLHAARLDKAAWQGMPVALCIALAVADLMRHHRFHHQAVARDRHALQDTVRLHIAAQGQHQLAAPSLVAQRQRHGAGRILRLHDDVDGQALRTCKRDDGLARLQPAGFQIGELGRSDGGQGKGHT
ncbi:hypothetical protein D3C81_1670590 [compost metagenome]